jgi:two-component system alkaline phosphatase synthesis response regulator PhoP
MPAETLRGAPRVLIVEDEEGLVLALEDRLSSEGYQVHAVGDGLEGQLEASRGAYDLIILDVMLPGRDGFQVCQNLRASGCKSRILMLTARGTTIDTVMGLRLGADDYLTKPFDMQVLLARAHALLRRLNDPDAREGVVYRFGEHQLDTGKLELYRGDQHVPLNAQEYKLLEVFVRNPNRVLSREQLLDEAWGYDADTTTRTVDVHVAWLRRKLGEKEMPRHLITVRGYGYKFVPEGTAGP